MNMKSLKIYTVTYDPCGKLPSKDYVPIVAGAAGRDLSGFRGRRKTAEGVSVPRYVFDNDGENISAENPTYSEFTALYWMWKHAEEEIVGEAHYRRFFVKMSTPEYLLAAFVRDPAARERLALRRAVRRADIARVFEKGYNCILPRKTGRFPAGLYNQYAHCGDPYLLDASREIVAERFPAYLRTFDRVMKSEDYYLKCIFIMPRELFREYMNWMFTVFGALAERFGMHGERELAFLGERLMNVWMEQAQADGRLRPYEMYYYNTEIDPLGAMKSGRDTELCIPSRIAKYLGIISRKLGR
ncbi:MAG: DUF4422 domain-containing protein [Lachnospiraceae bacterium]|nr:DUF4422 domain-containing protein [Lachnospiraceae bacterium]